MNGWINGLINEWREDISVDGSNDGWMDGWMDGWIKARPQRLLFPVTLKFYWYDKRERGKNSLCGNSPNTDCCSPARGL